MYKGSIKNKQKSFSSVLQEKRAIFWSQQEIEWLCIMGSSY